MTFCFITGSGFYSANIDHALTNAVGDTREAQNHSIDENDQV